MNKFNRTMLGFTLVEMVITMIIMGIVALGVSSFMSLSASGYITAIDRERLLSKARFVSLRMKRELQNAIPNSVAIDRDENNIGKSGCISFTPILAAGNYFDIPSPSVTELHSVYLSVSKPIKLLSTTTAITVNPRYNDDLIVTTSGARSAVINDDFIWNPPVGNASITTGSLSLDPFTNFTASPASRFYAFKQDLLQVNQNELLFVC